MDPCTALVEFFSNWTSHFPHPCTFLSKLALQTTSFVAYLPVDDDDGGKKGNMDNLRKKRGTCRINWFGLWAGKLGIFIWACKVLKTKEEHALY